MAYWEPIAELDEAYLVKPASKLREVTHEIARVTENRAPRGWWICFLIASTFAGIFAVCVGYLFYRGVGVWGNTAPVYWAWDITNFVWWVGIGHAGTLISAILFLFRQRVADGHQPLRRGDDDLRGHLRPHLPGHPRRAAVAALLRVPAPEPDDAVAELQVAAALGRLRGRHLLHGVAALLVHGPHPRPGHAARPVATKWRQRIYGFFALGWRGSNRHWQNYERAYLILAAISTPLVLSVHSVVSFDFATSVIPGLAHDDLPAVLRRRRHLLRLRDGRDGAPHRAVRLQARARRADARTSS